MEQKRTNGKALTRGGQGLLVILMAFCLLAVGAPVQADPPGSEYNMPFMGIPDTSDTVETKDGDQLTMVIDGPPTISLGNPKSMVGGGTFSMTVDGDTVEGNWEVTKLDSFHSVGRCVDSQVCLDTVLEVFGADGSTWEAGTVRAKIVLKDEEGEELGRGRLTVTCSLPDVPAPPVKDHLGDGVLRGPEGFEVELGSLHFGDGGRQQRGLTLFTRLAD